MIMMLWHQMFLYLKVKTSPGPPVSRHHGFTDGSSSSFCLRVGPAVYDDAPSSAAHGAATCVRRYGDVPDEPPQHHCKHGGCSPADTHSCTPRTCHQGNAHKQNSSWTSISFWNKFRPFLYKLTILGGCAWKSQSTSSFVILSWLGRTILTSAAVTGHRMLFSDLKMKRVSFIILSLQIGQVVSQTLKLKHGSREEKWFLHARPFWFFLIYFL